jgi:ferritin
MISNRLKQMLNEQVGHELSAQHAYLGMAAYFGLRNHDKWASIFHEQALEERVHALKIIQFLVDVGAQEELPALPAATVSCGSALDVVKAALNQEQQVSAQFQAMAKAAIEESDFTAFQFLQWFIEEQVEEEAKMEKFVALLSSEKDEFRAEMIVSELEEHGGEGGH